MKIFKSLIPYMVIIILVIIIRSFIITPAIVNGASMDTTLKNGEVILIKKYDKKFDRFNIIVFDYEGERLIKRVIGLPGEHIKYIDNDLYVNDKLVLEDFDYGKTLDFDLNSIGHNTIPKGYYFVLGDNREVSKDSRIIGLVSDKQIVGSTSFAIYPFQNFGFIK